MNLQRLFNDAKMSIRHGLVPIKATILAAAVLTVTGVFSVGLFSLLALSICLYNAGRRVFSILRPNAPSTRTPLEIDSTIKASELYDITQTLAAATDTREQLTHYGQALEASCHFIGGQINQQLM